MSRLRLISTNRGLIARRSHHVLTLLLDGKLFLAPLDTDKIQVRSPSPLPLDFLISLVMSNSNDRKYLTLELEPVYAPL